jgi:hypothetical protein
VIALLAWEIATLRGATWMRGGWYVRVVAFIALSTVVPPTLLVVLAASLGENIGLTILSPILMAVVTAACLYYYQYRKRDLFILTCCAFAVIMVVTSFSVRLLLNDFGSMLFLAMLLIGQVAWAAYWLRNVARRWEAAA